jgi:hypothetical protein
MCSLFQNMNFSQTEEDIPRKVFELSGRCMEADSEGDYFPINLEDDASMQLRKKLPTFPS